MDLWYLSCQIPPLNYSFLVDVEWRHSFSFYAFFAYNELTGREGVYPFFRWSVRMFHF